MFGQRPVVGHEIYVSKGSAKTTNNGLQKLKHERETNDYKNEHASGVRE
jgi:hypothetical protein